MGHSSGITIVDRELVTRKVTDATAKSAPEIQQHYYFMGEAGQLERNQANTDPDKDIVFHIC